MAIVAQNFLSVPQYAGNGSVAPVALGGATDVLTVGGWIENNGPNSIFLVSITDTFAASNPERGVTIEVNKVLRLYAGTTLGDYGVLADGGSSNAYVLGS